MKSDSITFHGTVPLGLSDHASALLGQAKVFCWGSHPRDKGDSPCSVFDLGLRYLCDKIHVYDRLCICSTLLFDLSCSVQKREHVSESR